MENSTNPSVAPQPRRQYTRTEVVAAAQPYYPFTSHDEVFYRVMASNTFRETSSGSGFYDEISFEESRLSSAFTHPPAERLNPHAAPAEGRPRQRHTRAEIIAVSPLIYPTESPDEVWARVMTLGLFGGYKETEPGSDLYEYLPLEEFLHGPGQFESRAFGLPSPESPLPLITAARPRGEIIREQLIASHRAYGNGRREELLGHYTEVGHVVLEDPRMKRYTRANLIIPIQETEFLSADEAFERVISSGNYRETEMGSGLYERVSWVEFLEFARRRRLAQSNNANAGAGSGEMDWNAH